MGGAGRRAGDPCRRPHPCPDRAAEPEPGRDRIYRHRPQRGRGRRPHPEDPRLLLRRRLRHPLSGRIAPPPSVPHPNGRALRPDAFRRGLPLVQFRHLPCQRVPVGAPAAPVPAAVGGALLAPARRAGGADVAHLDLPLGGADGFIRTPARPAVRRPSRGPAARSYGRVRSRACLRPGGPEPAGVPAGRSAFRRLAHRAAQQILRDAPVRLQLPCAPDCPVGGQLPRLRADLSARRLPFSQTRLRLVLLLGNWAHKRGR